MHCCALTNAFLVFDVHLLFHFYRLHRNIDFATRQNMTINGIVLNTQLQIKSLLIFPHFEY